MEKDTAQISLQVPQGSGPSDPNQELKNQLAVFLLSLIQAFLRTGYYTPNHPESLKAKAGLYETFQSLFTRRDELTFLVRDNTHGNRSVLTEGVLPDPQPLKAMMLEGMAEMYTPRFVKFLERKDLVSLTLKNTMSESEFIHFVDLMSEPRFVDTREEGDKERFAEELRKRGICNISYVFNEELLATQRKLPWRARLALTRLKKDVSTIPLFLKLGDEELRKVRGEIVRDIARPIREASVLYPILMNTDLAVSETFSETEIDQAMVAALSPELLLGTSRLLLEAAGGEGTCDGESEGKNPNVAKLLAHGMNQHEVAGREPILEGMFRHSYIPLEDLPGEIRYAARLAQLTDTFVEQADTVLRNLNAIEEPEAYRKAARSIVALVPELLRRDAYDPILKIITRVAEHAYDGKPIAKPASDLLDEIIDGEIGQAFKTRFLTAGKEHTDSLAPVLVQLRQRFLPHVIEIVKESNDVLVRKKAWDVLREVDASAMDKTLARLTHNRTPTDTVVSIIRLLGDIDTGPWHEEVTDALRSCLLHQNPLVRQEALWVYFKLRGEGGETEYLGLLDDPDVGVQKQAILCLGKMRSMAALDKFLALIREAESSPSDKLLRIEERLFSALGQYGNIELQGQGSLEEFLLETLDRRMDGGALKFLKKKKTALPNQVVCAICESLGKIGTEKSSPYLKRLSKQETSPWSQTAEEALSCIRENGLS